MIKQFKIRIKRNYYKVFDRNSEVIDQLITFNNSLADKVNELVLKVNELENEVKDGVYN